MSLPLLEGEIESPESAMLREIQKATLRAQQDAEKALAEIQQLKAIVGRMVQGLRAATSGEVPIGPSVEQSGSLWESRIAKAGGPEARILQTLVDGGEQMTLTQIRTAARTFNNTSTYLNRLLAKNWVQKLGNGMWALK